MVQVDEKGFWMAEAQRKRRRKLMTAAALGLFAAGGVAAANLWMASPEPPKLPLAAAATPEEEAAEAPPPERGVPTTDPFTGAPAEMVVAADHHRPAGEAGLADVFSDGAATDPAEAGTKPSASSPYVAREPRKLNAGLLERLKGDGEAEAVSNLFGRGELSEALSSGMAGELGGRAASKAPEEASVGDLETEGSGTGPAEASRGAGLLAVLGTADAESSALEDVYAEGSGAGLGDSMSATSVGAPTEASLEGRARGDEGRAGSAGSAGAGYGKSSVGATGLGIRGTGAGGGGSSVGVGGLGTRGRSAGGRPAIDLSGVVTKGAEPSGSGKSGKVTPRRTAPVAMRAGSAKGGGGEGLSARSVGRGSSGVVDNAFGALKRPKKKKFSKVRGKSASGSLTKGGDRAIRPHTPSFAPLAAASTDDNVTFDAFVGFLAKWSDRRSTAGYVQVPVRDRRFVEVVDADGRAVPAARVVVRSGDRVVWRGTTYGDGRAALYRRATFGRRSDLTVQAIGPDSQVTIPWGKSPMTAQLPETLATEGPVPLDVVFLIDATGSMGDEIARIKGTLLSVTKRIRGGQAQVDLRYGAVLYRDRGDEYVTKRFPLTSNLAAFDRTLHTISANGGGDTPESLNAGLAEAVNQMKWREGAAKVTFLIADAPPHMDYGERQTYAVSMKDALSKGIRIHTVAASGLDQLGSLVFRQIAQLTLGKFIFIKYGSTRSSAAKHGVKSQVDSNNLDTIIYRRIRWEIDNWAK